MNLRKSDVIDDYLRGELSGNELASFESEMQADPSFKEVVQYEQFIKDGLSQVRKAEMKSRLNAIEITPDWFDVGAIGRNVLLKTIGGTLAIVLIGTIAYYSVDTFTEKSDNTENVVYVKVIDAPVSFEIPAIEVPESTVEILQAKEMALTAKEKPVTIEKIEISTVVTREEPEGTEENAKEFVPQVNVPNLNNIESEDAIEISETVIPELSTTDEIKGESAPLDVKTVNRKSEKIKYKYFDGKLYLYGDFGSEPYEILEINRTDERKIYVYFDSDYYEVKVTDKVEELPKIINQKLKEELEILRNNKLND